MQLIYYFKKNIRNEIHISLVMKSQFKLYRMFYKNLKKI